VADTLATILRTEPDWSLLPPDISPTVFVFLRRSLQKDPKQRVGDIRDVRLALEGAYETASSRPAVPPHMLPVRTRRHPLSLLGAGLAGVLLATLATRVLTPSVSSVPAPQARFAIHTVAGIATNTARRRPRRRRCTRWVVPCLP